MSKFPSASIVPPGASTKMLPETKACLGSTRRVPRSTKVHEGQGGLAVVPEVPKPPSSDTTVPVLTKSPTAIVWVSPSESSSNLPALVKVPLSTKVLLEVLRTKVPALADPVVAVRATQSPSFTVQPAGTVPVRVHAPT